MPNWAGGPPFNPEPTATARRRRRRRWLRVKRYTGPLFLLLDEPLHEDRLLSADFRGGAADGDDVRHEVDRLLAELGQPIAARVVLLVDQQVRRAVLGEQAHRLAGLDALLATIAV